MNPTPQEQPLCMQPGSAYALPGMEQEGNDEELMMRYREGDAAAFEVLYKRHKNPLYRYVLRQCGQHAVADELFQDIWTRVIQARKRYQASASFKTFLSALRATGWWTIIAARVLAVTRLHWKAMSSLRFLPEQAISRNTRCMPGSRPSNCLRLSRAYRPSSARLFCCTRKPGWRLPVLPRLPVSDMKQQKAVCAMR